MHHIEECLNAAVGTQRERVPDADADSTVSTSQASWKRCAAGLRRRLVIRNAASSAAAAAIPATAAMTQPRPRYVPWRSNYG